MRAEPELPGSNAFPALWLLEWDVPEQAQAAIAERDAARFRSLPPPGDPARAAAAGGFHIVAVESYPRLDDALAREPDSCGWREGGCIGHVRANRDAHARRLAGAERLVDRVEAVLAGHDHYRTVLPLAMDMPVPRLQFLPLAATRHALQFVDGEADLALANNCRVLSGLRRLAGNSDSLLVTMALAADLPARPPEAAPGRLRFERVANMGGCVLMDIARPAYASYGLRMQDAHAWIWLLRILEWMRARASGGWTGPAEALLAQLPEELQAPVRIVDIDPATGRLRMELFHDRPQTHWSVPLPAALRPDGAGAAAP